MQLRESLWGRGMLMAKITCVVDNNARKDSNLKSEHGVSFWIEIHGQVVLFDTGQTSQVFAHNLNELEKDVRGLDALALSHAHYDHTGGLDVILAAGKKIPLYALEDLFRQRYSLHKGVYKEIGIAYTLEHLQEFFTMRLSDRPQEIVPNLWTTGAITERPERVGGSEHLLIRSGDGWLPDSYNDDMSLVIKTKAGLVLICGCCHAGILNTLLHVEREFQARVKMVIGGSHLVSADDSYLEYVIHTFQNTYSDCQFYLNHCTGEKALRKMFEEMGGQSHACPAGTVIILDE